MSKAWTDASVDERRHERRTTRRVRRTRSRRAVRRRRVGALFVTIAIVVAIVLTGTSLAGDDDAFSGLWWEPSSGRRIEIVPEGDGYRLLYGAQQRPFAAEKRGDELVIAAPLGGDIVVRVVAADRLQLIDGGQTTTLRPAPDGS